MCLCSRSTGKGTRGVAKRAHGHMASEFMGFTKRSDIERTLPNSRVSSAAPNAKDDNANHRALVPACYTHSCALSHFQRLWDSKRLL